MGQYSVVYSCGCEGTVNLHGKHTERESKLEWLNTVPCYRCRAAEEDKAPIDMEVKMVRADEKDGAPHLQVALRGGTRPKKEDIKLLGYRWTDLMDGWAWVRQLPVKLDANDALDTGGEDGLSLLTQKTCDALGMEAGQVKMDIPKKEMRLAKRWFRREEKVRAKIAEIEKPERPACHPLYHPDKVIYGKRAGNYHYYLDGVKQPISDDEHVELMAYVQAHHEYVKKCEAIKHWDDIELESRPGVSDEPAEEEEPCHPFFGP